MRDLEIFKRVATTLVAGDRAGAFVKLKPDIGRNITAREGDVFKRVATTLVAGDRAGAFVKLKPDIGRN